MRSEFAQSRTRHAPRRDARGFTLIELMITLTVLVVVLGTLASMLYLSSRSKTANANRIESVQSARTAMEMIAGDLRSAGYNADIDWTTPQPQIAYIDSTQVLINADLLPYPQAPGTFVQPRAYQPAGNPKPAPLNGTAWAPPIKYRTGAEVIRYSLDANNDGTVTSADQSDPNGSAAGATRNPNDFVLLRQVYGDSTGNVANNNGGAAEQIAMVNKPGGSVPALFTVYMRGSATPYSWAGGPVPASQLRDIERIVVQVAAPSSKPDSRGNYASTVLRTEIHSMRNVPNFGATQYAVSGYVYNDLNKSDTKDAGESGIPGTQVRLGTYSTYTDAGGFYLFRVFAGNYTLRHTPASGYGSFSNPDTFLLNITAPVTRSFADTARSGGSVTIRTYEDANTNGSWDTGENWVPDILATLTPGPVTGTTDASGRTSLFAATGSYSVSLTLPDSFVVATTPYPVTGTMTNGGSASHDIGLRKSLTGHIAGKVFVDNNRDAVWQAGEAGIQNVWVGVTNDAGTTIVGYAYTDASGLYDISVPINDPPHTTPYSVFCIPPAGKFPTGATSIPNLWVQNAAVLANNNFGAASFQVITLNASRVLSLSAGDLIEKDWNGSQTQNAVGDADIVLGADAGGTDNISVWFNQYPPSKGNVQNLFTSTPDYTRNAPQSVMSIALDTLDSDATWKRRPDVVTGTRTNASGNFFVWLNQNTSSNYGFLPTSYSPGLNYRTTDNGDVQAVLTNDCTGGAMPDIIVGTKSGTAGSGTIEVWRNSDAVSPTFAQLERYPNTGSVPGNSLGEVNTLVLADLNNDGLKDLIAGTKVTANSGELAVFRNNGKSSGSSRFECTAKYTLIGDIPTAIAAVDVDGNGYRDLVVGTQASASSGNIRLFRSVSVIGSGWSFANTQTQAANGIVMSMVAADYGGTSREDVAVGWRSNTSGYVGGISVYFTDLLGIPPSGVDPSAGSIAHMVPAVCRGNFDYGVNPLPAAPYLADLAVGVKTSATTGALVVFIR